MGIYTHIIDKIENGQLVLVDFYGPTIMIAGTKDKSALFVEDADKIDILRIDSLLGKNVDYKRKMVAMGDGQFAFHAVLQIENIKQYYYLN